MSDPATLITFFKELRHHWLAAATGVVSLAFAAFSAFSSNTSQRTLFAGIALASLVTSAYDLWKSERRRVLELERKLLDIGEGPQLFLEYDSIRETLLMSNRGKQSAVQIRFSSLEFGDLSVTFGSSKPELHSSDGPVPVLAFAGAHGSDSLGEIEYPSLISAVDAFAKEPKDCEIRITYKSPIGIVYLTVYSLAFRYSGTLIVPRFIHFGSFKSVPE